MAMFEDFRGFEYLYDAQIETWDGYKFPVHRLLLAKRSDYFRTVLFNSPKEKTDFVVPEIKGSTLKIILDFMYSGNVTLMENTIADILEAAYLLGMEKLLEVSKCFATANLTETNCVPLLLAGTKNKELGILKASSRFVEVNFERIIRDRDSKFEDLSAEVLDHLLFSDYLNVSSEHQIWRAIEMWISKFPDDRKKYLQNLIPCIRFNTSDTDLSLEVLNHPFIKENSSYSDLVNSLSSKSVFRNHRIPSFFFFFINTQSCGTTIKLFITCDENIDMWRYISSGTSFFPDVVLHGLGPIVVMFETTESNGCTFDILTKTWSTLSPMNMTRWEYSVVKLGEDIYVLGGLYYGVERKDGKDEDIIIRTIERYNFESKRWELVTSYDVIVEGTAATIDDEIYIIGSNSLFSSLLAQVYNPITDSWRTIRAPKIYRRLFALAVYKKQLLIVGGKNTEEMTAVEVYETDRDNWREFQSLPSPYSKPKAVVLKDILYIYECHSISHSFDYYRFPPVFWNELSCKWQVVEASSPFTNLHNYQFCTIENSEIIMEIRKQNIDPDTEWKRSPFFIHLNF